MPVSVQRTERPRKRNHSATHLLHAALRQVLGDHVAQKGSLVNPERLRFDFAHFEPVTAFEINTVERLVNEQIRLNNPVSAQVMAKNDALNAGAMALFGEKYGDEAQGFENRRIFNRALRWYAC